MTLYPHFLRVCLLCLMGCLFIIAPIFSHKAIACCSCLETATTQTNASWNTTLDTFRDNLDREIVGTQGQEGEHQKWIKDEWWDQGFRKGLKGLVGSMTADSASRVAAEGAQAATLQTAQEAQNKALALTEDTIDNAPSEAAIRATAQRPGPQLRLDHEANTLALTRMEQNRPSDAAGNSLRRAEEACPDGRDILTLTQNSIVYNPLNGPLTQDGKCGQLILARLSGGDNPFRELPLEEVPVELAQDMMRLQGDRAAVISGFSGLIAGKLTPTAGEKSLNEMWQQNATMNPNDIVALGGEEENQQKQYAFVRQTQKNLDNLERNMPADVAREQALRALLIGHIEGEGTLSLGYMPNLNTLSMQCKPSSSSVDMAQSAPASLPAEAQ